MASPARAVRQTHGSRKPSDRGVGPTRRRVEATQGRNARKLRVVKTPDIHGYPIKSDGRTGEVGERARTPRKTTRQRSAPKRPIADAGTMIAVCIFVGFLILAGLHAVLVQNQAELDDLITGNQKRQEQINQLLADIAYLDSPEGAAEQAAAAGLVPAAEVVTLGPVSPGVLLPPGPDPFGLAGLPEITDFKDPEHLNDVVSDNA